MIHLSAAVGRIQAGTVNNVIPKHAEVNIIHGYRATYSDATFTGFVADAAKRPLGEEGYEEMTSPIMDAEDFSYILQECPCTFAFLGTAPPGIDPDNTPPCHSNRMVIDESAMAICFAMPAAVALEFLAGGKGNVPTALSTGKS